MNLITFTLNTKSQAKTETKKPGVLTKGWFKYIIIRPSNDSQNFEENPDFGHESTVLSSAQKNEVDDIGSVSIPDKNSF